MRELNQGETARQTVGVTRYLTEFWLMLMKIPGS
jgi:hypothetical protein